MAILSIPSAEPNTPEPTKGTCIKVSKPCTVPSSPLGPCRMGNQTSTSPTCGGNSQRLRDWELAVSELGNDSGFPDAKTCCGVSPANQCPSF